MSPEKVAILVVAGLIAVLLAVALLGTEPTGSGASTALEKQKALVERAKPAPKQIEEYTYQDIVRGNTRPVRAVDPKPQADAAPAKTTQYVVKKNDTIEKIARRELGNSSYVSRILALNKGVNPSKLAIGTKLELPVVKPEGKAVTAEAAPRPKTTAPARGKKETVAAAGKSL